MISRDRACHEKSFRNLIWLSFSYDFSLRVESMVMFFMFSANEKGERIARESRLYGFPEEVAVVKMDKWEEYLSEQEKFR